MIAFLLFAAQLTTLPVTEGTWVPGVLDTGTVAIADAARLSVVPCPQGKCLSVGQWRAGRYGARYRYAKRIDGSAGVIRGGYRTSGIYPRQAGVTVQFPGGRPHRAHGYSSLGCNFALETARVWMTVEGM